MSASLQLLERIIDTSRVAGRIEALLPIGVRPRQLSVRTLLLGMLLCAADHRPGHLRRLHQALSALPEPERLRLGVIAHWQTGPHQLTYRQVEYTFALVVTALSNNTPDGSPSQLLADVLDRLLEASVQMLGAPESRSYTVDWTDQETWSRPPPKQPAEPVDTEPPTSQSAKPSNDDNDDENGNDDEEQTPSQQCADPEASWGHRRGDAPGQKDETFFGYYLQAVTVVKDENGSEVPELVRRIHLASCNHDPPPALVPVIEGMHQDGIPIADLLADSGYSYRVAEDWALPLRRLGIELIQDLHPNDRGTHGTHHGAICHNGNLYCPATPTPLLELSPLPRGATPEQTDGHDRLTAELSRHKLSPITSYDQDGYRRVICPAVEGKLRCPLRPASMTLPHTRPQVLAPPEHPPTCCQQQTITVPPSVNAKTAQKHDYPSHAHRHSYNRRSAAERAFSTVTDPATTNLSRGWCRLMGLTPTALFIASAFIARNLRINHAFNARQAEQQRRAACGLPPKRRRRRRQTTDELIAAAHGPP